MAGFLTLISIIIIGFMCANEVSKKKGAYERAKELYPLAEPAGFWHEDETIKLLATPDGVFALPEEHKVENVYHKCWRCNGPGYQNRMYSWTYTIWYLANKETKEGMFVSVTEDATGFEHKYKRGKDGRIDPVL